ncbi:hypothetical protein [Halobaculum magnesiiphilum]|uniref:Uncharacterized protein n=1 Tax=Halobaculum magnesiiphilum TaxID=1017351 RepID=A0A8T8WH31_9EURY|nr:hypothetical protein [Halobaculum magnesiiphilum]QZP39157.1 hypothetical protein K6T50_04570 [Halobaculum magnesiiphilum]
MSDENGGDGAGDGEGDSIGAGMHEAVAAFLAGADDVYEEYDQGYMDADAALSILSSRIDDLRDAAESAADAGGDGGDE